jgi:hypothetical protein
LILLAGGALYAAETRPPETPTSGPAKAEEPKREPKPDVKPEPKAEAKAEAEEKAGARASLYLLVDHLSPALYEGEPLTACLRVENTTEKEADVEVRMEVLGAGAKVLKEDSRKVKVAVRGQASCRFDVNLSEVQAVRFSMRASDGETKGPCVSVLRSGDPWPGTKVEDGLLTDAASRQVLLPVVARCERKEERSFAPLSWLVSGEEQGKKDVRSAFALLPGEWLAGGKEDAAGELVPGRLQESKAWGRVGPHALQGVAPALLVVGDVVRALPNPAPDRVIVLWPAGDLDAATDPRLFRIAVEVLVARLELAGVKDVVLSCPVLYGVSTDRVEMFERAAREAVKGRPARLFDRHDLMDESLWRLDAKTTGVYGRRPNEAGRKMIRQALADLIP